MKHIELQVVPTDDNLIMISHVPGKGCGHPFYVARFYNEDGCGKQRAQDMIDAWNAHDALLAALKEAHGQIMAVLETPGIGRLFTPTFHVQLADAMLGLKLAIALAEEAE